MKIAFVFDAVYPHIKGGVEKRIWELSTRLAKRGHDVHIYGMKYWDGKDVVVRDGVTLHGVCRPVGLYNSSGRRSIRQVLRYTFNLPSALFRERFDLVDCQASPYFPALVCRIYCTLKGIPLVITWHEVWGSYWTEYLGVMGVFARMIEVVCAHLAGRNFAVSESTRRDLRGIGGKNVAVVPNGVDSPTFEIIPPSNKKSDMIFIGRLIRDKNVDLLLDAVARLGKVKVLVVGDGPERKALEEKAKSLGIEDKVEFTGFLPSYDQIAALLKSSKVFVFPSTREGFGIVAVEAMRCGLPVVTVRHERNAAADLVDDGVNGFVVPLDASDLAKAAGRILSDSGLRDRMGEAARKKAGEFDWDTIAETLEKRYLGLL